MDDKEINRQDRGLLKFCIQGDKSAWDNFVQKYSRLVYKYIYNILKVKGLQCEPDTVKDIFQGFFLSLIEDGYSRLKKYKGRHGCTLSSWLRTLTINFTIDYLRKIKPALSLDEEIGEDFTLSDTLTAGADSSRQFLKNKERLEHLEQCIDTLGADDKYFLDLYMEKRVTTQQMMNLLRINRSALDMRKFRIISRLKDCFRKKGVLDF